MREIILLACGVKEDRTLVGHSRLEAFSGAEQSKIRATTKANIVELTVAVTQVSFSARFHDGKRLTLSATGNSRRLATQTTYYSQMMMRTDHGVSSQPG